MYVSIHTFETWPTPNYVDPETRGNSVIVINCILYSLVVGVVGLRIFTRTCISRSYGADDTFILIAMVSPLPNLFNHLFSDPTIVANHSLRDCNAGYPSEIRLESPRLGCASVNRRNRREILAHKPDFVCRGKHLHPNFHALADTPNSCNRL